MRPSNFPLRGDPHGIDELTVTLNALSSNPVGYIDIHGRYKLTNQDIALSVTVKMIKIDPGTRSTRNWYLGTCPPELRISGKNFGTKKSDRLCEYAAGYRKRSTNK
jgi:hypothetical protein